MHKFHEKSLHFVLFMNLFKYSSKAYSSRLAILLADSLLAVFSLFLASALRMNFELKSAWYYFGQAFPLVFTFRILSFRYFRTYAIMIRYSGLFNLIQVFNAVAISSILIFIGSLVYINFGFSISRSIIIIDFFILTILLSAFRLLIPLLVNQTKSNLKEKVIIMGSGKLGLLTKQFIENSPGSNYKVLAFADDDPTHEKKFLDGTPILKPDNIKDSDIKIVIFPISDSLLPELSNRINFFLDRDFKILKVPIKVNWGGDIFKFEGIKPFEIEDLLGREPIKTLDLEKENVFLGKTIMITGAAGSIGSQIAKQLIDYKPGKLILVDQAESPLVNIELDFKEKYFFPYAKAYLGNICDLQKMEDIYIREKPEFIFHAAAYKHVPIIEDFPDEAVKTNIKGTKILADLAHKYETLKFIMISTDKAVNPTNVMGASKRIAEIYCQSLNKISSTAFITTRFGNVLGSAGSVVPRFKEQIEKGVPLTVTHPEVKRYFMTIQEASLLVIEAGVLGDGGEIFLFDMGEPIKIFDLAKKMVLLSGKDLPIVFTGLRPGEKLYEELLISEENSLPTLHPRLTIAKITEFEFFDINEKIQNLINHLDNRDELELVRIMKSIVVEYKSENSPFEKLDFQ